jgi:hypothetical protein
MGKKMNTSKAPPVFLEEGEPAVRLFRWKCWGRVSFPGAQISCPQDSRTKILRDEIVYRPQAVNAGNATVQV